MKLVVGVSTRDPSIL